ncbi:MAG: hypothetical protein Q9170_000475 [Blastenia crenularia]
MSVGNNDKTSSSSPRMISTSRHPTDEETPLLQRDPRRSCAEDGSVQTRALLRAAALVDGPGLEAGRPAQHTEATIHCSSKAAAVKDGNNNDNDNHDSSNQDEERESPYLSGISKQRFWVLYFGVLLQYFVACFDSTMMASSHPNITSYFKASDSASWLSTAFLVTYIAFQPLYSRLSDFIGRRPVYFFSLIVFCLTSVWCALAQSIESLIVARAFCGLGAGGMVAMGAILTNDLVPMHIRGFYQALINLFWGTGAAAGAAFGGFVCDTLGWRWTFGVQVPPILCILALAVLTTPKGLGPHLAKKSVSMSKWEIVRGFDLAGSFLLMSAVSLLILGLNVGGNVLPWSHPFITIALVLSAVAGTVLVWVERRAAKPVMPLKLLASSPRGNLIFNNFLGQLGVNAVVFNAPLYFQAVHLDSPSMSGFRLAAPSLGVTCCGVASSFIMDATGYPKPLIIIGSVITLAGGIAMAALPHRSAVAGATVAVFFPTTGTGLSNPATAISNLAFSLKEDQAVMSTTQILWRGLGTVMGVALSSLLVQNALPRYLEEHVRGDDREESELDDSIAEGHSQGSEIHNRLLDD